jgi:hypothetical protein
MNGHSAWLLAAPNLTSKRPHSGLPKVVESGCIPYVF